MKKENKLYKIIKPIIITIFRILYRPTAIGKENIPEEGALIFAGNHKHAFDPLLVIMSTKRVVHYMAKNELFKGLHGKIFDKIGLIRIYKNKPNQVAVIEAEKILNQGGTVGIFPEGTRNKTKQELLRFKHGTVMIARKTNTKIVPFAIKGDYKLFRKNIAIEFGKPIDINKIDEKEANEYLKSEVSKLLNK